MFATDDTIVAIATPPGQGGVGIVRLSGPAAWQIGQRLFARQRGGRIRPHYLDYGHVVDPVTGAAWDDGLIAFMRAPHSYTGDDVVEINAHGSPIILRRMVEAALAQGARAAEPGEMTLRAFLHGRIDLAQAEAVADLIAANSDAAARQALGQLAGQLSAQVQTARVAIFHALAPIEASIDFPEEEVPQPQRADVARTLAEAATVVADLLAGADRGRVARDGVRCVITGRPNVGKSSLLNHLLRADRAIVTPIAGTTRDTIEETALLGGVAFHLVDTAGITATADPIEQIGIARSRQALADADLALLVLDRAAPLAEADRQLARELADLGFGATQRPLLVILNKSDLPPAPHDPALATIVATATITTSLVTQAGLAELEAAMVTAALGGPANESAALVARARHRDALRTAQNALAAAQTTLRDGMPWDLVAEDLHDALDALGLITGESVTEDLLGSIFSEFCIGK
jgi:tRNA modification GTPase